MSSDEIVWQVINQQFCSFKLRLDNKSQTFCRNEHNVTGFCSRQSCPLANSRYATVRPDPSTGALHLYVKVAERAHLPSKWWERVQLADNYEKALAQIDDKLIYWPKFLVHKCKQRLTRLTQVAIRSRRIAREEERLGEKVVPRLAPKVRRREATRERKAESAAKVERAIERELIDRLKSGAYGDRPLNVEENVWKKVLKGLERAEKGKEGIEDEQEEEEEQVEGDEASVNVEYVSDLDEEEEMEEMEDFEDWLGGESAEEDDDGGSQDDDDDDDDDDDEDEDTGTDEYATNMGGTAMATAGAKRKRQQAQAPAPQSSSKAKARKKPPRMEIEYETEIPVKELSLAR